MQHATAVSMDGKGYVSANFSVRLQSGALGAMYGFSFFFLVATVLAVWAAYDGAAALNRFFWLLGGILFALAAPLLGRSLSAAVTLRAIRGLAVMLVTSVAVLYLLQRIGAVTSMTMLPGAPSLSLSDNLAAQILAMGLPLLVAVLWHAVIGLNWSGIAVIGGALLLGVVAIALTESRGALLGLAAAALVTLYLVVRTNVRRNSRKRSGWLWLLDGLAFLTALGAVALFWAIIAMPELDARLGVSAQGGSALSRIALWRDSLPLIGDYYFTGSGLGTAVMVYATYAYLLHVPYLYHAHNFYLQVALEQGVPALLAWFGLVTAVVFYAAGGLRIANRTERSLLIGGFAALAAFLVHSFFEAELYFSVLGGLVFFAPAMLLWIAASIYEPALDTEYGDSPSNAVAGVGVVLGLLAPVLLAALAPGAPARLEANLGAVEQTRVELGVYERPLWSFQDQVRRDLRNELEPAEAYYRAALQFDPAQPTAHRRLGAIALARSEFERARNHLITAHAAMPSDRAARQLLGEVLALDGDVEQALALWEGLDMSQGQLMVREWWYQGFGEPEQAERLADAIRAFQRAQ
jgi:O-antigen ligase